MSILYTLDMKRRKLKRFIQRYFFKMPKCKICKTRHSRRKGWAHIDNPTCTKCDEVMSKFADEIMREIVLDSH